MIVPAHEAPWNLRGTASGDVPAVLDFVADGMQGYRDFAPATWVPPFENSTAKVERTLAELADPGTFSRVAEVDGRIAGFAHWCEPDPPVAIRLRFLFVAKPFWGTGLARLLHDESVAAMGGGTARLFHPERPSPGPAVLRARWLDRACGAGDLGARRPARGVPPTVCPTPDHLPGRTPMSIPTALTSLTAHTTPRLGNRHHVVVIGSGFGGLAAGRVRGAGDRWPPGLQRSPGTVRHCARTGRRCSWHLGGPKHVARR